MPKPKKLNQPWTAKDIERMRKLAGERKSAREAAKILGRTRGAVAFKAMNEGISFRAILQPAGVQKRIARAEARAAA